MTASTAVQSDDLVAQIEELRDQVSIEDAEAKKSLKEYLDHMAKKKAHWAKIGELAQQAASEEPSFELNGVEHAEPHRGPAPKHRGGRPAAGAGKAKPGPKARGGKSTAATKGARGSRMYGQAKPLPKVVWDILDRSPSQHRKLLPNMPKDAIGLRIVEIKEIIEAEGEWKSSSDNIAPQIQQALGRLAEQGKIGRNEEQKRWFIAEGAEYDGPALDEHGKPVKE